MKKLMLLLISIGVVGFTSCKEEKEEPESTAEKVQEAPASVEGTTKVQEAPASIEGTTWKTAYKMEGGQMIQDVLTFTSSQVTHVRTTKQGAVGEPNVGTYTYDPPAVVAKLPNWDPFIQRTVLCKNPGTVSGDILNLKLFFGDEVDDLVFEKQ